MKKNESIFVDIQEEPLKLREAADFVNHEEAGAVNIFKGTTGITTTGSG